MDRWGFVGVVGMETSGERRRGEAVVWVVRSAESID